LYSRTKTSPLITLIELISADSSNSVERSRPRLRRRKRKLECSHPIKRIQTHCNLSFKRGGGFRCTRNLKDAAALFAFTSRG